jgi:hypothetical protein
MVFIISPDRKVNVQNDTLGIKQISYCELITDFFHWKINEN